MTRAMAHLPAAAVLACAALLAPAMVQGAPAPWYYWRSKVDGQCVCAQVSPGQGWERDSEPYAGPGCTAPRRVFVIPMR
jgi:hypothetical protein